jgi:predicted RND superfamily exporter protein
MYDEYLPYEFHLRMTRQVAKDFRETGEQINGYQTFWKLVDACAGHDLIEDTRKSYNDIFLQLQRTIGVGVVDARDIVEMIFAVSNETGRNRAERANAHYYEKIRATPGAKFVKLCDKISNVRYSVMTKSDKLQMHKKEHINFLKEMQLEAIYQPMIDHLTELLTKA